MTTTYPDSTNPMVKAIAEATLAYAVAIVDDSADKDACRDEWGSRLDELAWMLGLAIGGDEYMVLGDTLAAVCGKALAHGTHKRGR